MEWDVVAIEETSGNNVAFVSIGRGQLDFSAVACELVGDNGQYKYVKLLTAKEDGKPIVGVKFLIDPEPNTLPIKKYKKKCLLGYLPPVFETNETDGDCIL